MGADRTFTWDKDLPGFGLQVTATGHRSFVFQYRVGSTSRRMKLDGGWFRHEAARAKKDVPVIKGTPRAIAKREAEAVRGAIAQGRDPLAEMRKAEATATNTVKAIAEQYLARDGNRLRSKRDRERLFKNYVYPRIGQEQIEEVTRRDIVKMLDAIETENGPVQADHVLAVVRKLFNWHAARVDDFRSPIVRGMARTKPKERRRQRILTDDELRAVWTAAEGLQTPFGWLVRFILLTATRRNEAARMSRAEVSARDWIIPGRRHKSKLDFLLPLSDAAAALLASIPVIGKKDGCVFTSDGKRPIGGFSKFKREFDKLCGVKGWTLHDLRRTSRSLMSRCGVDPDHAERALGHVIPGIRGTYDVYEYREEKARAFEALAAQIDRIVNPQANVVAMNEVRASGAHRGRL
jgi:integrase